MLINESRLGEAPTNTGHCVPHVSSDEKKRHQLRQSISIASFELAPQIDRGARDHDAVLTSDLLGVLLFLSRQVSARNTEHKLNVPLSYSMMRGRLMRGISCRIAKGCNENTVQPRDCRGQSTKPQGNNKHVLRQVTLVHLHGCSRLFQNVRNSSAL